MIKVLVNGAFGRVGSEVVRTVIAEPELELAGGVDIHGEGKTLPDGRTVYTDLSTALAETRPDVVVDFYPPGRSDAVLADYSGSGDSRCSGNDRFYNGTTGGSKNIGGSESDSGPDRA